MATSPSGRSAATTARERVRQELTNEIKRVATAHLAAEGGAALSLRAIAREMGMASSALFRYFPTRDALLTALIIDTYGSVAEAAEAAEAAAHDGSPEDRWLAIAHGVRGWALAHPHEYALIFGSPIPGYAAPQDTIGPASRIPVLLGRLLWDMAQADDGAAAGAGGAAAGAGRAMTESRRGDEVPADVVEGLRPLYGAVIPEDVPVDLVVRGLMAWTYLFGAVSFEIFGHRHGVVGSYDAFFDLEMRRLSEALGLSDAAP